MLYNFIFFKYTGSLLVKSKGFAVINTFAFIKVREYENLNKIFITKNLINYPPITIFITFNEKTIL